MGKVKPKVVYSDSVCGAGAIELLNVFPADDRKPKALRKLPVKTRPLRTRVKEQSGGLSFHGCRLEDDREGAFAESIGLAKPS